MNLKRLEIIGFKSFADKTIIDFNEGITGIVGPNGSGKSNFADAIRWVLGEQAPTALRGKKMTELIFKGTAEGRSSHSYCEVSLVFDNTNKKVFPTLEFDEVKITRKLFKSGDSEYSINGNDCLLKNIKEIIRDTGLGREGYSIIGQGKVAEIINAKAENRRVIFEEAAGISNFKNRKNEAENNLAKTRADIERLDDIIKEISRRLPNLEKQSRDAKKFATMYEELKINEVNHYLYNAKNNIVIIDNINQKLDGIRAEIANVEQDLVNCDAEYVKLNADLAKNDNDTKSVNEARTNLLLDNQKKVGESEKLSERLTAMKQELERTESILDKNYALVSADEKKIKDNKQFNEIYLDELAHVNSEYDKEKEAYDALVQYLLAREQEIESSHKAYLSAVTQLADVKVDNSRLVHDCDYLKDKLKDTVKSIKKHQDNLEEKNAQRTQIEKDLLALQTQRNAVYKDNVALKNAVNNLKFEQNTLNSNIRMLSNSVASFEAKNKVYESVKNQYENFLNPVKQLMQECNVDNILASKIIGVVAELIKVPEQYEIAIEVSLGMALQNIVTANVDDVKYAIEVLKRKRLGSVTFLPISSMRPRQLTSEQRSVLDEKGCLGVADELIKFNKAYEKLFSNLLGGTIICDTYDNAVAISKKYNRAFRIVTLEGELFATQGSITGGSRRQDVNGILSQERESEQILKLYEKSKSELAKASARITDVDKEYSISLSKLQNQESDLRSKDLAYNSVSEKANEINDLIDDEEKELAKLNEQSAEYNVRIIEIESILSTKDRLELDIATSTSGIDEYSIKAKAELDDANKRKTECSEKLSQLRVERTKIENAIQNCESDTKRLLDEIATKNVEIATEIEIKNTLSTNIIKTEETINSVELSEKDKERLSQIEKVITELDITKQGILESILKCNIKKDELNKTLSKARENVIKEENTIDKLNAQIAILSTRISEEYQLDLSQCKAYEIVDYNDSGANALINNLKREIGKLGAINTEAIADFDAENERYTYFTSERDDLNKSEKNLQELIKNISKEMVEMFNYEFGKISRNFEITFKELFGGGKGRLVLDTACEDQLNAGVEIEVALPGKVQNNIASLSGGEMALTAIAILFAILKSKPMPFCVLDEIEAALDDSNVRLFARYLKRFASDTQFIVITHRKPTMEQTNRLYGVTMEERGVSKVVSVELSDAMESVKNM